MKLLSPSKSLQSSAFEAFAALEAFAAFAVFAAFDSDALTDALAVSHCSRESVPQHRRRSVGQVFTDGWKQNCESLKRWPKSGGGEYDYAIANYDTARLAMKMVNNLADGIYAA